MIWGGKTTPIFGSTPIWSTNQFVTHLFHLFNGLRFPNHRVGFTSSFTRVSWLNLMEIWSCYQSESVSNLLVVHVIDQKSCLSVGYCQWDDTLCHSQTWHPSRPLFTGTAGSLLGQYPNQWTGPTAFGFPANVLERLKKKKRSHHPKVEMQSIPQPLFLVQMLRALPVKFISCANSLRICDTRKQYPPWNGQFSRKPIGFQGPYSDTPDAVFWMSHFLLWIHS